MNIASISLIIAAMLPAAANGQLATRGGKGRHLRTISESDRYLAAESLSLSMAGMGGSTQGSIAGGSKSGKSSKAVTARVSAGVPFCTSNGPSCSSGDLVEGVGSTELLTFDTSTELLTFDTLDGCSDGRNGTYLVDESVEKITVIAIDGGDLKAGEKARIEAVVHAWTEPPINFTTWALDSAEFYYTENIKNPVWTYIGNIFATGPGLQTLSIEYTLPDTAIQAVRVQFGYDLGDGALGPCAEVVIESGYDDTDDLVLLAAGGSAQMDGPAPTSFVVAEGLPARRPKPTTP